MGKRGCVSLSLILAMGLCVSYCGLVMAAQAWASRAGPAADSLVALCAWTRGGRVGLWWNTTVAPATAFANAYRYNAVCAAVPWTETLPERGRPSLDVTP